MILKTALIINLWRTFMIFKNRDYTRTENDDYKLNIEPHLNSTAYNSKKESIEIYDDKGNVIGWKIQDYYE